MEMGRSVSEFEVKETVINGFWFGAECNRNRNHRCISCIDFAHLGYDGDVSGDYPAHRLKEAGKTNRKIVPSTTGCCSGPG